MFLTRSEYDRGVNTFSPEGRLFQVEYAIEAIKLGSTAVGIQVKDGVVIAVEKRLTSPLLVSSSVEKIMEIVSIGYLFSCTFCFELSATANSDSPFYFSGSLDQLAISCDIFGNFSVLGRPYWMCNVWIDGGCAYFD